MSERLPDFEDRRRGVTDFQRNWVVTAGAGTGKTSLLVGRLLTALVKLHMEPHEVLALTFTENAAIEMRARLSRLLRSVGPWVRGEPLEAESDRPTLDLVGLGPEYLGRVEDVLADADRLPISTFHGFCLRLLQQHAAHLGLPPDLDVGELDATWEHFSRSFLSHLRELDGAQVHPALSRFDPAELRRLAWELLSVPEDAIDRCRRPQPPDLAEPAHRARRLLQEHPRALERFRECVRQVLHGFEFVQGARADKPEALPKKALRPGRGVPEPARSRIAAELQAHLDLVRPWIEADEAGIAVALDFVRPFVQHYRLERQRRGELTFDDLLLLSRKHLIEDPELRRRAGGRVRAILVDEFQDTDPLQYDVVFLLASEPVDDRLTDPMEAKLRDDALFIVGDPKQSIYRFRRADIAAFARATRVIEHRGGGRLELVSNFRSAPPVLELANRVCERTLTTDPPYQLGYEPVTPTREATRSVTTEILVPANGAGLRSAARRQLEGRLIVQKLDELHGQGLRFGDMAVLLRAATETSWLLRPLRRAGIPYVLEGSRRFYRRHEIVMASALIAAMARPHDPVPVLGLLRSARSRATDRDIQVFTEQHRSLDFRRPIRGRGPVQELLTELRELHGEVRVLPVDRALVRLLSDDVWTLTDGGGFEGAQRIANLERLLDLLLREPLVDLHEIARFLEGHTARETEDEESPLFDRDFDAVRVLTVHAAKGLEFGAVLVPDLARLNRSGEPYRDARVERLFDRDGHEILSVRVGDCRNVQSFQAETHNREHAFAEERRLFYVAVTRARDYVGLVCGHDSDSRSVWQTDLVASLGVDLTDPDLSVALRDVAVDDAAGGTAPETVIAAVRRHDETLAAIAAREPGGAAAPPSSTAHVPRTRRRAGRGDHSDHGDPLPLFAPRSRTADLHGRAVELGSLTHQYLALVDVARTEPDFELLAALTAHRKALGQELETLVRTFHASDLRRRMDGAATLLREVPVAFVDDDGQSVSGTIDALLRESDTWSVIDYKTDRVLGTAHAEAARAYRPQLQSYGDGVRAALRLATPPRLEVWFARDDATVVLD